MRRLVLAAVWVAWMAGTRCGGAEKMPHVSITLPDGVSTDAVQIKSFLYGPFGAYGGFTFTPHGRSFDVDAFVGEIAAKRFRAIVYVPGCELSRFDLPVRLVNETRQLECRMLAQVPLYAKVALEDGQRTSDLEVRVVYQAMWAFSVFGISDGPTITFEVATVPIREDGSFMVTLPELNQDPIERSVDERYRGSFLFILREKKTWNVVGGMKPTEFAGGFGGLELRSWYPAQLGFALERWR